MKKSKTAKSLEGFSVRCPYCGTEIYRKQTDGEYLCLCGAYTLNQRTVWKEGDI